MRTFRWLSLLGGVLLGSATLLAQSDEYLDDTYMSRKDIEARQAKERAKAEAERKARAEAQKAWEERMAKEYTERQKLQRSREIDAYNGVLSAEDSVAMQAYIAERRKEQHYAERAGGYGEYSRRLGRFYGDGTTVVINNYYDDYDDARYWGRSGFGWGFSAGFYPWYDGYYSVYRHSTWSSFDYGWGYSPWYRSRFYGYYDPFYSPWHYGYGGYYGGYGYYSGFYSPYWGYYSGYPYGYSVRPANYNSYRGATRSGYNPTHSSYGAYQERRSNYNYNNGGNNGYYNSSSSYSGRGRSIYDSNSSGSYNRSEGHRSSSSSYSSPSSSSSAGSRSNYGGGSRRSRD